MFYKSFNDCLNAIKTFIPTTLTKNKDFEATIKALAYAMKTNYDELTRLDNAYNVDFVDIRELPKLADTIGIVYPIGADADKLRLLLKYYGKIIKNRGSIDSIKQMVRFLEYSEQSIYEMPLDDYSSVDVSLVYEGFIAIKCNGITDFDYAIRMLRKVVPAGYRFDVMNLSGPFNKGYEACVLTDSSASIQTTTKYSETGILAESATIQEL